MVASAAGAGAGATSPPNRLFTQLRKPRPAGAAGVTGAALTGATTGAGAGTGFGGAIGAGCSGRMPLITGSALALAFSRRVMPTSSSGSSIIV